MEEEEAAVRVCYRGDLKQLRQRPRHGGGESDELLRTALGGDARLKGGRVWLAASTHEGEEEIVLAAHSALRRSGSHDPGLLLILVPRHTERVRRLPRLRPRRWAPEQRRQQQQQQRWRGAARERLWARRPPSTCATHWASCRSSTASAASPLLAAR